jgi:tRNA G18 (ribose-2'-O)-methylase SpoU
MKRTVPELRAGKAARSDFPALPRRPLTLVLAGLRMDNLGSVFRLADAALVERVILCGVPYTPSSLRFRRAARGAERWVPHSCRQSAVELVAELKASGTWVVALEQAHGAVHYREAAYRFPAALVIGNEKHGVADDVLNLADSIVEIPMHGMANSLNVAVAAGILVYEILARAPPARQALPRPPGAPVEPDA